MLRSVFLLAFAASLILEMNAQIFEPKEPFGEPYGAQWNYVRNEGQTFDLEGDFRSDVEIQSVGTTPSIYLFRNSSTAFTFADVATDQVSRIDLTFVGENALGITPVLYHQTGMVYNFYEEHTPDGVTGVEAGKHAIYEGIYPDIDFHVLSNPWGPKFYIVLRPGADQHDLRLQVSGHDSLRIDISGDLKIWFENRSLRLKEGYAYQQVGQTIVDVPWVAHYENVSGSANVTFDLGSYDPALPLILCIKPWLPPAPPPPPVDEPEWSTYFPGNTQDDFINDLTHDGDGYVYYTGTSKSSAGLPISTGAWQTTNGGQQDVIIGRINSNYEITTSDTWMTYYGGSDNDRGTAVAYTPTEGGRLAVCGPSATGGTALSQTMGSSWNISGYDFLALFDPVTGERLYGTRLPFWMPQILTGAQPADVDYDDAGNLYLVGFADLITGSTFNTYVTGPSGNADYTSSAYFNSASELLYHDGYVARFNTDMQLTWLTALGGPNDERVFACAVDNELDRLVVVGKTNTKNDLSVFDCPTSGQFEFPLCYPTVGDAWHEYLLNGPANCDEPSCGTDGFITVFDLGDLHILYSSYFGSGHGDKDAVTDVVTDSNGNIYLTGWSNDGGAVVNTCQWDDTDPAWVDCDAGGHMDDLIDGVAYNHFIVRLNNIFEETWATRIAGDQWQYGAPAFELSRPRLAVDELDNIFMYASTASGSVFGDDPIAPFVPSGSYYSNDAHGDFPSSYPASVFDTYLLKFDPQTVLMLSTLFGGPGQDYAVGLTAFNGRVYVSGATGSQLFPTHAPDIPGAIPYLAETPSAATGDLDAFMAQLGFDITIGFGDQASHGLNGLQLFPNPTAGVLGITGLTIKGSAFIEILDVLGQAVLEPARTSTPTMTVDVNQLSPGSYMVREISPNGIRTGRFVKQ